MLRLTALAVALALVGLAGLASGADSAVTTKIVYHAKLRGNNEILVVPAAGGVPTRLTRHRASDSNPTWSADGSRIAFESNRRAQIRDRDADVYVMAANGTRVRQLTFSDAFDGDPAWSWLNRIAFESDRAGSSDIWAIDPDGTDEKQLTKSPAFDGDPAWSPDGSQIVFTSQRDNGDRELYVMNADGSAPRRLTNNPARDESPDWQPLPFDVSGHDACGDDSLAPGGASSIAALRMSCHRALKLAARWARAAAAGDPPARLGSLSCTTSTQPFALTVVDCTGEHRRPRDLAFVWRDPARTPAPVTDRSA